MPPIKVATRIKTVKAATARAETERHETKAISPGEAVSDGAAVLDNPKVAARAQPARSALARGREII